MYCRAEGALSSVSVPSHDVFFLISYSPFLKSHMSPSSRPIGWLPRGVSDPRPSKSVGDIPCAEWSLGGAALKHRGASQEIRQTMEKSLILQMSPKPNPYGWALKQGIDPGVPQLFLRWHCAWWSLGDVSRSDLRWCLRSSQERRTLQFTKCAKIALFGYCLFLHFGRAASELHTFSGLDRDF